VTFFWYLGGGSLTLLNTGMTRDGPVSRREREIAGPVQNFRWTMSPLVRVREHLAIGKSVPIHTVEAYDGPARRSCRRSESKTFI